MTIKSMDMGMSTGWSTSNRGTSEMSPRYEFDPSKASATQEIFPKGDYEFKILSGKAFVRQGKKGTNYGIGFALEITEGEYGGKKTRYSVYLHSQGAQDAAKRFQMAVFGYKNSDQQEKEFNAAMIGQDWGYDPETGNIGEAWKQMIGSRVIGVLDVGKNEDTDEPQQNFKSWRPAISVTA